ncbi:MAG: hypothetical protein ACRDAR_01875 [Aeromonas veronii]
MSKKPLHADFLSSKNKFFSTQEFWKKLIHEKIAIKIENNEIMFHTDGNPIYYNHFPSLRKSIRIIQEPFDNSLPPHLGAWIEPANDFREYDELVISIELTNITLRPVKKLISLWLNPKKSNDISEDFLEEYIQQNIYNRDNNHELDF